MKVVIYIRESGTRQYKYASPRAMYPDNATFCLRYTENCAEHLLFLWLDCM
jgi:hypothetical protein